MDTKWLKKLDEQKLIGLGFGDDAQILWARKNTGNSNNISFELLYISNLSGYAPNLDENISLDEELQYLQYFAGRAKKDEDMNEFIKKPSILFGESDKICLSGRALSENLGLVWVEIDSDFGNIINSSEIDLKSQEVSRNFIKLMRSFFYQPYYCEAMIDYFEKRENELKNKSKKMTFQEIKDQEISEKIKSCATKIADFSNELNYYRTIELEKNNKVINKALNQVEKKYNVNNKSGTQK